MEKCEVEKSGPSSAPQAPAVMGSCARLFLREADRRGVPPQAEEGKSSNLVVKKDKDFFSGKQLCPGDTVEKIKDFATRFLSAMEKIEREEGSKNEAPQTNFNARKKEEEKQVAKLLVSTTRMTRMSSGAISGLTQHFRRDCPCCCDGGGNSSSGSHPKRRFSSLNYPTSSNKMGLLGLHLLPLMVFILFPIIFAASYAIAVKQGHINPVYAYISDTGTNAPEQCVFGLGLSLAMVFVGATAYVRYKQVGEFLRTKASRDGSQGLTNILNNVGLIFGLLAALGTAIVGAFQETSVLFMHAIGAFMIFPGGSIFLFIQGILTLRMAPTFGSKGLGWFRVFLAVMCFILFFVCIFVGVMSMKEFVGDDSLRWESHHGGWKLRIISTVSEWICAALFDLYFLTFVPEFKRISFVPPQFQLVEVSRVNGKGNGRSSVVIHYPVNNRSIQDSA